MHMLQKNSFPIFIPTKGRYKNPLTIKAFNKINIPFYIVIEKKEYGEYKNIVQKERIIVLPHQNQGLTKTRNWIWDYAQKELKTEYFWTFDDNIRAFYRFNKNKKMYVGDGCFLKIIENFMQRYENLYICGMHYTTFVDEKKKTKPYILNTRVYSNMLIKTNIPYRNNTFYNDDTDLCLRILKDGNCTLLFKAFLIDKTHTMVINGGMTDYYKQTNKRLEFAKELQKAHPDVVKIVWKFNRWHHQVNYKPFSKNKLKFKKDYKQKKGVNNYGMQLINVEKT